MRLESVRSLKREISAAMLPELTAGARSVELGTSARSIENVLNRSIAFGVSRRTHDNYQLAVRVQHAELMDSEVLREIRDRAAGEVDLRYIGHVRKMLGPPQQARQRPVPIGWSVGHFSITAGSVGCFVRRLSGGDVLMLSNNHVLADENRASLGDDILQPGKLDGGNRPADVVAQLEAFVPLIPGSTNFVDCATATMLEPFVADRIDGIGPIAGTAPGIVSDGDVVLKTGRTTGTRRGRVTAFEIDNVVVGYDIGAIRFDDQIEVEGEGPQGFSEGGDSGSLILNDARVPVALLFAGSDNGGSNGLGLTYANPLDRVLGAMEIRIVTGT
jgi:hypothetical protein